MNLDNRQYHGMRHWRINLNILKIMHFRYSSSTLSPMLLLTIALFPIYRLQYSRSHTLSKVSDATIRHQRIIKYILYIFAVFSQK